LDTVDPSPTAAAWNELAVLTDGVLLERFLRQRDESAFALLVRRHGPMVRATCRRCLGDAPELDDAFQVVFLVLARKGGTLRQRDLLGPWLHMVALRAARKLRTQLTRRRGHEHTVAHLPEPQPAAPAERLDWQPALDEELRRLPQKLGMALILCELQGHSRADAARLLGVPEGTLSSRLARGRDLLRQRLARRGLTASALALTTALSAGAAVPVPAALLSTTTQAVTTGVANATVTTLFQGVLRAMFIAKCKLALLATSIVGLLALGLLLGASLATGGGQGTKSDKELLQGSWKLVSAEVGGKAAEGQELDQMRAQPFVFKGDKLLAKFECDYKIDPTTKPPQIDIVPLDGPEREKGKTFRGIYRIEGDQLTLCMGFPDGERPGTFTLQAGDPAMVMVLKRDKGAK